MFFDEDQFFTLLYSHLYYEISYQLIYEILYITSYSYSLQKYIFVITCNFKRIRLVYNNRAVSSF
jgi:hypothetical protein